MKINFLQKKSQENQQTKSNSNPISSRFDFSQSPNLINENLIREQNLHVKKTERVLFTLIVIIQLGFLLSLFYSYKLSLDINNKRNDVMEKIEQAQAEESALTELSRIEQKIKVHKEAIAKSKDVSKKVEIYNTYFGREFETVSVSFVENSISTEYISNDALQTSRAIQKVLEEPEVDQVVLKGVNYDARSSTFDVIIEVEFKNEI